MPRIEYVHLRYGWRRNYHHLSNSIKDMKTALRGPGPRPNDVSAAQSNLHYIQCEARWQMEVLKLLKSKRPTRFSLFWRKVRRFFRFKR